MHQVRAKGADVSPFAPHAHLTAIEDIWGPYYISRAKAMLGGSWTADNTWWGMKEGDVGHLALQRRRAGQRARRRRQDHPRDGRTAPTTSSPARISDQSDKERVAKGDRMKDARHPRDELVREGRAELTFVPSPRQDGERVRVRGVGDLGLREVSCAGCAYTKCSARAICARTRPQAEASALEATSKRGFSAAFKFVRQEPIGPYFADFVCREQKLVVEVAGATHSTGDERRRDAKREEYLHGQS